MMRPWLWERPYSVFMLATVTFTFMAACVKGVSAHIPVYETIFFRSLLSSVMIGVLLARQGVGFRANNLPLLILRAISGLIAMSCSFYAIGHLDLGDASVLTHIYPILAVMLSVIILRERPKKILHLWIAIAWLGIALILQPQLAFMNFAGCIALLAAFFIALNAIIIRQSHKHDATLRIAFYFTAACTLVTGPVVWQSYVAPTPFEWLLLCGTGILGGFAQIFLTRAYDLGEVSRLAPLSYFGVLFSYLLGLIFWGEIPTIWTLAGGLVVVICCIQIMRMRGQVPVVNKA